MLREHYSEMNGLEERIARLKGLLAAEEDRLQFVKKMVEQCVLRRSDQKAIIRKQEKSRKGGEIWI